MSVTAPTLIHATAANFHQTVLESDLPVLVDFTASWCPPCRLLKPEIERLAGELDGRARIVVVDVDEQPDLASRYGIQSIPALRVFHDGRIVAEATGFRNQDELTRLVQPFFAR